MYNYMLEYINNIDIGNKPIRNYFDESQAYSKRRPDRIQKLQEQEIIHYLVNSIRHNSISYSTNLKSLRNLDKRNYSYNYKRYKNAILERIAIEYPFLREECDKQKYKLDMFTIKENY